VGGLLLTTVASLVLSVGHPLMPQHDIRIKLISNGIRIGSYNAQTLHHRGTGSPVKLDGEQQQKFRNRLSAITRDLDQRSVGLCGLQETRIEGTGELMLDLPSSSTGSKSAKYSSSTGPWQLVWSGGKIKQHGVGLLLSSAWQQALLEHTAINDRLLLARFQCQGSITLSVVVAYAPTDGDSEADLDRKQQFYLQLYSALQRVQRRDLVVVLGDFNAQVGEMLPCHQHIRGPHSVQPQVASDNGMRLLDLASAQRLVLANTLFQHKGIHQYTHQLLPRQDQPGKERVIDYILCSSRFRSSIRDCRVFRGVDGSDHRLLVCTLQLRLSSARQQPSARNAAGPSRFNIGRLQQKQVQQQFASSMHNKFAALAAASAAADAAAGPQDAEAEWQAFTQATQATAAAELGAQPRRPRKEELSQRVQDSIEQKCAAYAAWQQKQQQWQRLLQLEGAAQANTPQQQPSSAQVQVAAAAAAKAKRRYRFFSRLVDRRLEKQRNAELAAQASKAERQWKAGHLSAFHKTVSRLFKDKPVKAGAQGLLSKDGRSVYRSTREQLTRFTEYFAEVFSGECITPEQQQQMEQLIAQLETLLSVPPAGDGNSADADSSSGLSSSSSDGGGSGSSCGSSSSSGGGSSPPSLQEVADAVNALRDAAAAGVDNIAAPLLKAGVVMAQWLHRVIVAVWVSGKAPLDWKRALIVPLFKGKGSARATTNHRPISLLSIPGKVYALILLHRVSDQVDSQLLESQCAFRSNRGLSDATYTLRSIMYKCQRYKQPLYLAFVDLRKAYDSIPRDALWRVLAAYGVEPKVIELLADLHTGTQAAVKLAGEHGDWFDIGRGVRQGCVIAPLLFNVFFDCVVRLSLAEMPAGCGVRLAFRAEGEVLPWHARAGGPSTMLTIAALMYADDLVLMSCDRCELELMLQVFDSVCSRMGMCVNAAKTELMAVCHDGQPLESVQLSDGEACYVPSFKYLGGVVDTSANWEAEVTARISKARGRFAEMQRVWGARSLSVKLKMQCFRAYVLPVLLFGSETWGLTQKQAHRWK
jgi:exonuclease III